MALTDGYSGRLIFCSLNRILGRIVQEPPSGPIPKLFTSNSPPNFQLHIQQRFTQRYTSSIRRESSSRTITEMLPIKHVPRAPATSPRCPYACQYRTPCELFAEWTSTHLQDRLRALIRCCLTNRKPFQPMHRIAFLTPTVPDLDYTIDCDISRMPVLPLIGTGYNRVRAVFVLPTVSIYSHSYGRSQRTQRMLRSSRRAIRTHGRRSSGR